MQGIYKLVFKGFEDYPYIGQSKNIEARYKAHLKAFVRGCYNDKLQGAYDVAGVPELVILEETSELNNREVYWIKYYNSVEHGLNITAGGDSSGNGYQHARSKFSREQILEAFYLLQDFNNTYDDIAEITGVSRSVVSLISQGRNHLWLKDEFPEEYEGMLALRSKRTLKRTLKKYDYPVLYTPDNLKLISYDLKDLAEKYNVSLDGLTKLISGKSITYKGFSLSEQKSPYPVFYSPEAKLYRTSNLAKLAKKFFREYGLTRQVLSNLVNKKSKRTKTGWRLATEEEMKNNEIFEV
jgi:group I intron endonuclease